MPPAASSKRVLLLVAVSGMVLGTAAWSWVAEARRPAAVAKRPGGDAGRCKVDIDCVLVPDDCCGCTDGGAQRSVPKTLKDSYEKERAKRCAATMCAQMMSQHPSCAQRAVCRAGACALGSPPANATP